MYHLFGNDVVVGWHEESQNSWNSDPVAGLICHQQVKKLFGFRQEKRLNLYFVGYIAMHESFEDRNMVNLFSFAAFSHHLQKHLGKVLQPFSDVEVNGLEDLWEQRKPLDSSCLCLLGEESIHYALLESFLERMVVDPNQHLQYVSQLSKTTVTLLDMLVGACSNCYSKN